MKNSLKYFYNINIDNLNQIEKNYYFEFQNNNFVVMEYYRKLEEAEEIFDLNLYMQRYFNTYRIITTISNNILFEFNNKNYILMQIPNINNKIIDIYDLIDIKIDKTYNYIDKSNWRLLWQEKIDYYENYVNGNMNKFKENIDQIQYYFGLSENAIMYLENAYSDKYICNNRMNVGMTVLDYLNPLELVVDYKSRDIGEYIKSYILSYNYSEEDLNKIFNNMNLNRNDMILLISRILFPSYFFDNIDSLSKDLIKKRTNIIHLIKFLFKKYSYLNIEYISWINR